jgi:predicted N-formylglutamate amidohydrolase
MGLLGPRDSQPVIAERSGSGAPFLFVCDHAGRDVPAALNRLGLPDAAFDTHIAWDIGAGNVTRRLGAIMDAPCVLQRYSRLVIDCNRDPQAGSAIPEISDGVFIPANQALGAAARRARVEAIHAPYHAAIAAELDARRDRGLPTILIFVHSFTPRMAGVDRPWRFGVIREPSSRFSQIALELLDAAGDFQVGDNLPYAMDGTDYSAPTHAFARGLDYLELEMRQDSVADSSSQQATVDILHAILTRASAAL